VTEPQPPKIEFPCEDYPIKILGEHRQGYQSQVLEIVRIHAPDLDETSVEIRESRNGGYLSVTVKICATGPEQLNALFEDLKASGLVKMVL